MRCGYVGWQYDIRMKLNSTIITKFQCNCRISKNLEYRQPLLSYPLLNPIKISLAYGLLHVHTTHENMNLVVLFKLKKTHLKPLLNYDEKYQVWTISVCLKRSSLTIVSAKVVVLRRRHLWSSFPFKGPWIFEFDARRESFYEVIFLFAESV